MAQQKCHFFCISAEYSLDQWRLKEIDLTCKTNNKFILNWDVSLFSGHQQLNLIEQNILKRSSLANLNQVKHFYPTES